MSAPQHDVAIYSPASNSFYEDPGAGAGPRGGGQELQMTLLAAALARAGLRVAHIVWPLEAPRAPAIEPGVNLVERAAHARGRAGKLAEARRLWSALRRADAAAYVFRGAGPQLAVGAAFCRLHRRKLVFSSAIDLEFDFTRPDRSRFNLAAYRAAVRRADMIVVQSERQRELAERAGLRGSVRIPSFAEPADPRSEVPDAFLWIGRLVAYKQPLEYVRLAASVPEARFRMIYFEIPETQEDLDLAAEFARRAGELPNLELLGRQPRGRTLAEIERATALVSTSRAEGMPNVFLEAWARGVPVLTLEYDPDGLIADRALGIAAQGSADALAEGARRLWGDPSRRDELGRNGRAFVQQRHSPDAVGARWAQALRGLIGGAASTDAPAHRD